MALEKLSKEQLIAEVKKAKEENKKLKSSLAQKNAQNDQPLNNTELQDFILKSLPAAIYTAPIDSEVDTTFITGNVKQITGFSSEEYLSDNKFWQNRIHPDDKERVLTGYRNNQAENEFFIEYRWLCADGKYKWFYDRCILKKHQSNNEYLGIMVDITARKMAEEALQQSDKSFTGLFNSVSEAIYVHKADGIFLDVNEGACKMYGYTRNELIGKTPEKVSAPGKNDMQQVMDLMKQVLETGQPQQFEFWAKRKNGEEFLKEIIYNKGKYLGEDVIITTARDITERKMWEEKIRQQNEHLEKINAEKDKFFSIIAHDLRSPFNGFLGLTEIMADKLLSMTVIDVQKHASIMKGAAVNLFRLLENLLEWTRMQQGVTPFKPEVFSLAKVANESIRSIHDLAKSKEIQLEVNVHENLFVYADIHMFESVCRNLTSNAVKFTPRGGKIWISAHAGENNFIEISIIDTGIGMNQEMVDNLFRIDRSSKRAGTEGEPSSGLGLLLCKEFVEKNNGRIGVSSKENQGTTFSFTLPLFFNKKSEDEKANPVANKGELQES